MIHPVSTTYFQGRCKDMKVETKEIERLQDLYCQIVGEHWESDQILQGTLGEEPRRLHEPGRGEGVRDCHGHSDGRLVTKVSVSTTLEFVPYNKKRRRVRR